MSAPTIIRIRKSTSGLMASPGGNMRYLIRGGEIDEGWRKSHEAYVAREYANGRAVDPVPSCEFTLAPNDDRLVSFGGAVWPSAWPDLFESARGTAQGNLIHRMSEARADYERGCEEDSRRAAAAGTEPIHKRAMHGEV